MSVRCPRRWCGQKLQERHEHELGRIALVCVGCEKNKVGKCRDCPAKLTDYRAMRCSACSLVQKRERGRTCASRRYKDDDARERHLASKKKSYAKPEVRARKLAYLADFRAKHPRVRDDGDRKYQRIWMQQARKKPAWRRRYNQQRRRSQRRKRMQEARALCATGAFRMKKVMYKRNGRVVRATRLVPVTRNRRASLGHYEGGAV